MQVKLFSSPVASQLTRLFGATKYDTKTVSLISIAQGKTTKDLNQCLNFLPASASGYFFDLSRMTSLGLGTLLGSSTDCTRTINNNVLSVSELNIMASASGKPTHLILGGIVPLALEIGVDINLLYPNSNTVIDVTAIGSIVYCPAFDIALPSLSGYAPWLVGNELAAIDSTVFRAGSFYDYAYNTVTANASVTNDTTNGIGMVQNGSPLSVIVPVDVSQSFTLDFRYRQEAATKFADVAFFQLFSSNTVRWSIGLEPAQNQFAIWNMAVAAKVSRPIATFNALKSTTFVAVKYVYDATTNMHRVFINGSLVDSFTYVNIKPGITTALIGTSGAYDATVKPYMDNIRVRQGVFL